MPNQIRNISSVNNDGYPYIFEQNVDVHIKTFTKGLVRVNVYRPKVDKPVPVLVTYGPYGKDIPYTDFNKGSYAEVNPKHKSEHAAWETPHPAFWTEHGYAVIRADECGLGQSSGSSGKVGLTGISYYAATQWHVAALQPKGLAAIIPWEGMSDIYRDASRHGGIASNQFAEVWFHRQVLSNQYGRPGRKAANWGPDTIEGNLSEEELAAKRVILSEEVANNRFRDGAFFTDQQTDLANIKVPLLSVANWGGISLHLRGNIEGFVRAGSELKYLRSIVGRHDLPYYQDDEVELQRSFFDAFLKGEDRLGWSEKGKLPPVDIVLRKGNPGFNNPPAELATFPRRTENEWPLARTQYTKFYLTSDQTLERKAPIASDKVISYKAPSSIKTPELVQFSTSPFEEETEITGHIVAHLNISASASEANMKPPSDIDVFATLRHFDADGKEIFYTGTIGDPIPVVKGWLRVSLRKVEENHSLHREYLPYREYRSIDVQEVKAGEIYPIDVELWPTNVVVEKGSRLVLELSSGDTQGTGIFGHCHPKDRSDDVFGGVNNVHFNSGNENYITLPIIPPK
ncbi:hypothetical protein IFR05_011609 [Cadophora sp. M221]|nr:hypothetical protein IFR05_011609 [Cadophora sp. M221]